MKKIGLMVVFACMLSGFAEMLAAAPVQPLATDKPDIIIIGRPHALSNNMVRCRGRREVCAVITDNGSTMEMVVNFPQEEGGKKHFTITAYQLAQGEEEDEPVTDIHYVPAP